MFQMVYGCWYSNAVIVTVIVMTAEDQILMLSSVASSAIDHASYVGSSSSSCPLR
jgi:hypothetical protein